MKDFHDREEEIVCPDPISTYVPYSEISMDDNKKFSIREYRESLYSDIMRRKKEQKRKWQQKFLQKLGVVDTKELFDDDDEPPLRKEPEKEREKEKEKDRPEPRRPASKKDDRPEEKKANQSSVNTSNSQAKNAQQGQTFANYKAKKEEAPSRPGTGTVGARPQSGTKKW